jgi:hypothetical protein
MMEKKMCTKFCREHVLENVKLEYRERHRRITCGLVLRRQVMHMIGGGNCLSIVSGFMF